MDIRVATAIDVNEIVRIGEGFTLETDTRGRDGYNPEDAANFVDRLVRGFPDSYLAVAEDNNKIVGMIGGALQRLVWERSTVFANHLFWWVDIERRGAGIGNMLLNGFIDWAQAQDVDAIKFHLRADLTAAQIALSNMGAKPTEIEFTLGV